MFTKKHNYLLIMLAFALFLRLSGINWDSGYHFHPDERMLIMVADRIHFFSNLNPHFFNYGSLPIYILRGVSQILDVVSPIPIATYDGMLSVGRMLSTMADLIVIYLIYLISYLLNQNKKIALWSSFFYTIAFFPIQNSHFFIVDTFLNLFSTLLIFQLLLFYKKPSYKKVLFIGITFAAAVTSKVSAIIFLPIIGLTLIIPRLTKEGWISRLVGRDGVVSLFHKQSSHLQYLKRIFVRLFLFGIVALIFTFVFMPYAFIEYEQFLTDVIQQVRMNSDAYIFPYTLQYVGTAPYWYYLKNIFIWGLGPVISILSIIGVVALIRKILPSIPSLPRRGTKGVVSIVIFLLFYLIYFLIIGKSAVKFMRYMLPMYPFFAIMAGYGTRVILNWFQDLSPHSWLSFRKRFRNKPGMAEIIIISSALLWTTMFLNIYSTPNTRIQATRWINQFIPEGATLAVEHWDDRVPVFNAEKYHYEELTLYDIPDDKRKWEVINQKLDRADYIIIASNRLYAPLQRLEDCTDNPRCYPMTADYYRKLFNNELDFVKIAEFTSYPRFRISNFKFQISDQEADESFTVYDHPTIMIFGKK